MEFRILGPLAVRNGDQAVELASGRQRALLALLILNANETVSIDRIVEELWGERSPQTAPKVIQNHVSQLRRRLGHGMLVTEGLGYRLSVEPGALDVDRFEELLAEGRGALERGDPASAAGLFRKALDLWRGTPLADIAFEPFAQAEIARLEDRRLVAVEERIEADLALGRHSDLVGELEALTATHPTRERLRAQLMLALYRSGRQSEALVAYQNARQTLVEELGIEPGRRLRELHQSILTQDPELDHVSKRTLHPTNLPVPVTRLIGRARELSETGELLASHRLVSLIGTGGSGKTRLAIELAAAVSDRYPEGVWWVPLQAVRDPELVEPAIASAVGAKDTRLSDHIGDQTMLLLLDNFEQVVEAAPLLADALGAMPNIKILTTSREPLRIPGEQRYYVEPLSEADAATLFNERATAVNSSFEPTESVAWICRRLDGLPLAVELAAARVAVLHPDDLLTRLEHSLPVLTSGARDAPGRQRTLRATLDWSYDLLDDEEKGDFARLAVFEGGFDAESAVAVAGVSLDALQSLIEKSLVRLWGAGRFGMLETLHEYAVERFTQLLDHDEVRRLHAEHYLARAPAETDFLDDGAGIWLDFLETERENFRGALAWSASSGRLDLTCRLAACFAPYWGTRGSSTEALTWMEATLDARGSLAPEHRARYLRWAAYVAFLNGGLDRAWPLAEEALALSRLSVDARGEGSALLAMATYVYDAGQLDDAARLLEEAADAFRRLGTGWGLPAVAINLGNIAVVRGDYERAEQAYTEALVAYRALNSPRNVMVTLANLANLCVERGVPHEAVEPFREAFEIAANDEDRHALAHVVNIYSRIALAEGSWRRAAVLIGSRDHLVEETGERFLRDDERIAARERDIVQAVLGEAAFSEAWAEGAALELGALVSFVRETLAKTEFGPRGRAPTT